ncbi:MULTISPECIES: hypothetical protein [Nonomuraea]|uniref:Uncharacterized protein n=2 Tax=Nonomuraea TaxID=83681 RepID=A0ABW1BQS4_9ACTN|nr:MULTISPECIES: hypothetical protein [Nonomuraea]MDA0645635.1 hypothetical protein [Nonomuraea ferruginea]
MWTLLGAIGSLLVALSLSFLAVLGIAVAVLIWLALMASMSGIVLTHGGSARRSGREP